MYILEKAFFRRPRILNELHRLRLVAATSQTIEIELRKIEQYAAGSVNALEIGTYQGVSASRIAAVLASTGVLFCVDPWPEVSGRQNPCWQICDRHLRRSHLRRRIQIVRGYSGEMEAQIPGNLDFAFIDGDHSWNGISTDWQIVAPRIAPGGVRSEIGHGYHQSGRPSAVLLRNGQTPARFLRFRLIGSAVYLLA
jgi:hypothetical protein